MFTFLKYFLILLFANLTATEIKDVENLGLLRIGDCANDPNLVGFYLYPNDTNTNYSEEIKLGDQNSLDVSNFTSTKEVVFIIHGFLNNYTTTYSQSMKNAYLDNGFGDTANIIVVDWGKLASPCSAKRFTSNLQYPYAVSNVPIVGRRVAEFILFLRQANKTLNLENVHIKGFSLGAHISGIAGDYIKKKTSQTVGRITGLDPAVIQNYIWRCLGPLFGIPVPLQDRLKTSDATFVDIIHTDKGFGIVEPIGHADFYANSGIPPQPGCASKDIGQSISCSHNRAWQYYIYALTNEIIACNCNEYLTYTVSCKKTCPNSTIFGENTPITARGKYYFDLTL